MRTRWLIALMTPAITVAATVSGSLRRRRWQPRAT